MRSLKRYALPFFVAALMASGCTPKPSVTTITPSSSSSPGGDSTSTVSSEWRTQASAIFKPVAEPEGLSPQMVELGRILYYDPRLSKSGTISCNSCHGLDRYGVDGEPTSPGHDGRRGARNSPTVYNAALHFTQFWDGRAKTVEEQAMGPILNPIEMGVVDEDAVTKILASIPEYQKRFSEVFPADKQPLTLRNAAIAIGAFERGLVTPSPFDKYLLGDDGALTPEELAGGKTFVKMGCASCHSGVAVGGSSFHKLGEKIPFTGLKDEGRFDVTKREGDKGKFKVPSLRNISETGPYFHDGSVKTLSEAVRLMAKHQLGKEASEQEVQEIIAFLGALKGDIPEGYIAQPKLPASK